MRTVLLVTFTVLALGISPAAHADKRHYRDYAAVGDSITHGLGTSDWTTLPDGTWVRVAYTHSYPERAHLRYYARGSGCVSDGCLELGIRSWLPPMLASSRHQPTTLVLHLGVNDLALGFTAEALIHHARSLRRWLVGQGYRVVFGTLVPPPRDSASWAPIQERRAQFNEWVRTQHAYVDYAAALQCGGWMCPRYVGTLGDIHPGDLGAGVMGRVLRDWVKADAEAAAPVATRTS